MREREEIEKDGTRIDILQLEVLLDLRQLLQELKRGKKIKKGENKK